MTIAALIQFIILAVVVGLVAMLALWVLKELGVPEPFHKIARVIIIVVACLIILYQALPLVNVA